MQVLQQLTDAIKTSKLIRYKQAARIAIWIEAVIARVLTKRQTSAVCARSSGRSGELKLAGKFFIIFFYSRSFRPAK